MRIHIQGREMTEDTEELIDRIEVGEQRRRMDRGSEVAKQRQLRVAKRLEIEARSRMRRAEIACFEAACTKERVLAAA